MGASDTPWTAHTAPTPATATSDSEEDPTQSAALPRPWDDSETTDVRVLAHQRAAAARRTSTHNSAYSNTVGGPTTTSSRSNSSSTSTTMTLEKNIKNGFPTTTTMDNTGPKDNVQQGEVALSAAGRLRSNPFGYMLRLAGEGSNMYAGSGWNMFRHYIGQRLFYPGYTIAVRQSLRSNPDIHAVISMLAIRKFRQFFASLTPRQKRNLGLDDATASALGYTSTLIQDGHSTAKRCMDRSKRYEEQVNKFRHEYEKTLDKMINQMIAEFDSATKTTIMASISSFVLTRCYNQGVHIKETEFLMLRKYALYAQKNNLPLLFLPSHKSHIDYLALDYLLIRLGIALPHIAAGENLHIPIFGYLLKHSGAFYIRRSWGDDPLYTTLMRVYVEYLLKMGYNVEVFIEGTRSRIGKVLQPKFGFVKIILDAIMAGRVRDAIIVPVYIGYDKVIETSTYVNELLGTPKESESLLAVMSNFNVLSWKLGRIDIRFAKPYSLREYIKTQQEFRGRDFDPMSNAKHKLMLFQSFGYRILSDINSVTVTMPTALVGTILLTLRGRGVGRTELVRKVNWLKGEILEKGRRVSHFGGMPTDSVVLRAVSNLGDLVGTRVDLLETVYYPLKRFELSYYRNQVIHLFIDEALLAMGIYAESRRGDHDPIQKCLIFPAVFERVAYVSKLLKAEFVYGPGGLDANFVQTCARLVEKGVFTLGEGKHTIKDVEPRVGSKQWIAVSDEERRKGRETFDFYLFLIWPFVESYWLAAISLFSILPDYLFPEAGSPLDATVKPEDLDTLMWVDEKTMMTRIQAFARTLYYEGDLNYFESINKETLKNALMQYVNEGVLLTVKSTTKPPPGVFNYLRKEDIDYYKEEALREKEKVSVPQENEEFSAAGSGGKPIQKQNQLLILTGKYTWYAVHPNYIPTTKFPHVELDTDIKAFSDRKKADGKKQGDAGSELNAAPANLYDTSLHKALISRLLVPPDEDKGEDIESSAKAAAAAADAEAGHEHSTSGTGSNSGTSSTGGTDVGAPISDATSASLAAAAAANQKALGATVYPLMPQDRADAIHAARMMENIKAEIERGTLEGSQGTVWNVDDASTNSTSREDDKSIDSGKTKSSTAAGIREYYNKQAKFMEGLLSNSDESLDLQPSGDDEYRPDLRPFSDLEVVHDPSHESWSNIQPSGKLWELCERVGKYRREGKNRRDTATVANRVLRLAVVAREYGTPLDTPATGTGNVSSKKDKTEGPDSKAQSAKSTTSTTTKGSGGKNGGGSNGGGSGNSGGGGSTYISSRSEGTDDSHHRSHIGTGSTNDPLMDPRKKKRGQAQATQSTAAPSDFELNEALEKLVKEAVAGTNSRPQNGFYSVDDSHLKGLSELNQEADLVWNGGDSSQDRYLDLLNDPSANNNAESSLAARKWLYQQVGMPDLANRNETVSGMEQDAGDKQNKGLAMQYDEDHGPLLSFDPRELELIASEGLKRPVTSRPEMPYSSRL